MHSSGIKLSRLNKMMIIWCYTLCILKIIHAFATVEMHTYERFTPDSSFYIELIFLLMIRTYAYIVDFLTMITLLYLFYT